jgi:hypothetical protein
MEEEEMEVTAIVTRDTHHTLAVVAVVAALRKFCWILNSWRNGY